MSKRFKKYKQSKECAKLLAYAVLATDDDLYRSFMREITLPYFKHFQVMGMLDGFELVENSEEND
jgi:hypothetical protein